MATEIVTPYPLPSTGWQDWPVQERMEAKILERLGQIEERLSRIEHQLSQQQPSE